MVEKHKETKEIPRYKSLVIPSLTVFITSFFIMVLELVAGRLIARHLGSSLYTWTSVIGIVLAGITLGNYIGGRMADRFPARKTLASLFAISSITCVVIIILNNTVGNWTWLWRLSWPMHIFTHVCLVFLLPSTLLGTISPVVAKMALDRGLPTGRTVGSIYAWGAAGSIAGTFAAGYYLIAQMGTIAIIWAIAAALLLMAIFYYVRLRLLHIWATVFVCLLVMGLTPWGWARKAGATLALRKPPDNKVIYEDETAYCYVAVEQLSSVPDRRAFKQDKLKHSEIIMDDVLDLQYFYHDIFAAITQGLSPDRDKLAILVIGGGGYAYPRYVEKVWPGSQIDVVEIDPGVTEAAIQAFGLDANTSIRTFTMDGRNFVDALLQQQLKTGQRTRYDFIYGDAINDYSVPFQLTTRQFHDKIALLLTERGVYMLTLVDIFDSGLFVGAVVNTLQQTFPYVYVVTRGDLPRAARNTFVVVAAEQNLDVDGLCVRYTKRRQTLWHLSGTEMQALKAKSRGLVLTDDYAPVESLLAPVARADAIKLLSLEYFKEAKELLEQGKFEACVRKYRQIIRMAPMLSATMYNEMGNALIKQGKWIEAAEAFENSLNYIAEQKLKVNTANVHYNLAEALKAAGKIDQAGEHFLQAVNLNPLDVAAHVELAKNLDARGKLDKAIEHLQAAILFMLQKGQKDAAAKLQRYLQALQAKQSPQDD